MRRTEPRQGLAGSSWQTVRPMLGVRQYHAAVLLQSGKVLVTGGLLQNGTVLVAGGYNASGFLAHAEIYYPGS